MGALREQNSVICKDAHRIAVYVGPTADQRGTIHLLEFQKLASIHHAGDHLPDVKGSSQILADDPVYLFLIVNRWLRVSHSERRFFIIRQIGHNVANNGNGMGIILCIVIGYTGFPTVQVRPAQFICSHLFTGGSLNQRRASEKYCAMPLYMNNLITHGHAIGAACST